MKPSAFLLTLIMSLSFILLNTNNSFANNAEQWMDTVFVSLDKLLVSIKKSPNAETEAIKRDIQIMESCLAYMKSSNFKTAILQAEQLKLKYGESQTFKYFALTFSHIDIGDKYRAAKYYNHSIIKLPPKEFSRMDYIIKNMHLKYRIDNYPQRRKTNMSLIAVGIVSAVLLPQILLAIITG